KAAEHNHHLESACGKEPPGKALERGKDQGGEHQTAPDRSDETGGVAVELHRHGNGQSQHDGFEGQDNGADSPHDGYSFCNRWMASPAVTTEPVISTPPPPNSASRSARATAWSIASSSRSAAWTRSGPKTASAV